jgi:hypothetical protein
MKIYFAASKRNFQIVNKIARQLTEKMDVEVWSQWHMGNPEEPPRDPILKRDCRRIALDCLSGITFCDVFVLILPNDEEPIVESGGKDVELGIALALNTPCVIYGEWRNVYHCLEKIVQVDYIDELIDVLHVIKSRIDG